MQQLTFIRPRVIEWREAPAPKIVAPRQAIVAPLAATTCDLDRSLIKGRTPYAGPIALGHEFVAEVVEVGDGVRDFVPGDTVCVPAQISCGECDRCRSGSTAFCRSVAPNSMYGLGAIAGDWGGGFSDLVRVPFADAMLVRLPVGVRPETVAAASDNLTNAYEVVVPLLERNPGASVVVAGVGSTGFYAVQMAKAIGASRVDYLDHDRARLALAATLGATPIDLASVRSNGRLDRQYDIAVDARGEPIDLAMLLSSLAPRGTCISVSMYFEAATVPLLTMLLRGARLELTPTNVRAHLDDVLALIAAHRIAPERVTTEVRPWSELPDALADASMKPVFVRDHRVVA